MEKTRLNIGLVIFGLICFSQHYETVSFGPVLTKKHNQPLQSHTLTKAWEKFGVNEKLKSVKNTQKGILA